MLVGVRSGVGYTGGFAWKPVLSHTSLTGAITSTLFQPLPAPSLKSVWPLHLALG